MQPQNTLTINDWVSYHLSTDSDVTSSPITPEQTSWLKNILSGPFTYDICQGGPLVPSSTQITWTEERSKHLSKMDEDDFTELLNSIHHAYCFQGNTMIASIYGIYVYIHTTQNDTVILYSKFPSALARSLVVDV